MDALIVAAQQLAAALGEPAQPDLLAARQMQAMSFIFHIPLVCFGIAFPAMVALRRGAVAAHRRPALQGAREALVEGDADPVRGRASSPARSCRFEFGLLWPNFMATFGDVFGLGFALEGFSFFLEAIFIAIYVYGWDRLSPRAHFLAGIPIVIAGITGSLMVISVNGWMNHPTGFDVVDGEVTDVDPWAALFNDHLWYELTHMYLAGLPGRRLPRRRRLRGGLAARRARTATSAPALVDPAHLRRARRAGAARRRRLGRARGRQGPAGQARRLRGPADDRARRAAAHRRHLRGRRGKYGIEIPELLSLLAYHDPNAQVAGPRRRAAGRPPAGQRRPRSSFQAMVAIGTGLAALGVAVPRYVVAAAAAAALAVVLPRRGRGRARCAGRADRGWITTEVGRQPWIVYERDAHRGGGHRRRRAAVRATPALATVYLSLLVAVVWLLRRLAATPAGRPRSRRPGLRLMLPELCHRADRRRADRLRGARRRRLRRRLLGPHRRRRERGGAGAGHGPALDGPGLGGQPRLADLRPGRSSGPRFPVAFGSVMSTLYVPLFIAAIGIIFRGTAFALRGQAATIERGARCSAALFALSSVLVPFCLGAALGAIASGRVPVGNAAGDPFSSWLNPTGILVGALAVLTGAYLAAVLHGRRLRRAGTSPTSSAAFAPARWPPGSPPAWSRSPGLLVLREDARELYDGLTSGAGLACRRSSRPPPGVGTLALVWRGRSTAARFSAAVAVGRIIAGWAFAQSPDLLPGELTIDAGRGAGATLVAVLVSVAFGHRPCSSRSHVLRSTR